MNGFYRLYFRIAPFELSPDRSDLLFMCSCESYKKQSQLDNGFALILDSQLRNQKCKNVGLLRDTFAQGSAEAVTRFRSSS